MTRYALDLFAGAGGFSDGAAAAGYSVIGVEVDEDAARSHHLAGHQTIRADVRDGDPRRVDGVDHVHASPPCQTFTKSGGRRKGRAYIDDLAVDVKRVLAGDDVPDYADPRTLLTLEPARWLAHLRPRTITLEQVPAVLPVWEAYALALAELGYATWAGLIDAEQYGAPQARRRAWMMARLDATEVAPPAPTHSRYWMRTPDRLDPGVARWVRICDALPDIDRAYLVVGGIAGEGRPRHTTLPAPTMTGRGAPAWIDSVDQYVRPWPKRPPYAGAGDIWPAKPPRNVTPEETAGLMGFALDRPFDGGIMSRYLQAGNAVPPQVARALVEALA